MNRFALPLVIVALSLLPGCGGKLNSVVKQGDACPEFGKLEGVDGKAYSLADFKDKDVLVLALTCNHCPTAVAYEDRIIEFARKHAPPDGKVALVAINVNNLEEDKLPKMKERAKSKGFTYPYLYDPSQKIARDLGAAVTPEFFVYDKNRKLVYTGSFDDKINGPTVNYLEAAVQAALNGTAAEPAQTKPFGCSVKFDK